MALHLELQKGIEKALMTMLVAGWEELRVLATLTAHLIQRLRGKKWDWWKVCCLEFETLRVPHLGYQMAYVKV